MSKVVINERAVADLLRSDEVTADLLARGERVKAVAEGRGVLVQRGEHREPMPYTVEVHHGSNRNTVRVTAAHPAGLNAEAKYHTLTAALDAAGG